MKPIVYIDGKEGTTGLQIYDRIGARDDITLLLIDEDKRKDPVERQKLMNAADLVFLCLPDAAAREAVTLVTNPATRIIDASTAHRTSPGWDYGFAELSPRHRAAIQASRRVANPGCHASGFIAIVYPLVACGLLPPDALLSCHSITGYSGGGKKMIAQYEAPDRPAELDSPRQYGLSQTHKHLPEMQKLCGLAYAPIFNPIVADFYKGMAVSVPLHSAWVGGRSAEEVRQALAAHYEGQALVHVAPEVVCDGMLASNPLAGTNEMELCVCGNAERMTVVARFDNLGKGASGAAVQNMNLMLGFAEKAGL
ncbi:MAG: N-acetyl-gamma-glutamyl-phosphate reductase [Oscillospiraceae bacterium]|nr:N-acetyl-gamma-glutamyl-phosphate reductase [Oscillospiraceae bacterium]